MAVLRYNPVFKQWVLLGENLPRELVVHARDELDKATRITPDFQVVTHPHSPFILDTPDVQKHGALLYQEEAPVGEYELVRYLGNAGAPKQWGKREWEGWLQTIAGRIALLHRNPHLHHVMVTLASPFFDTTGKDALRVADIIATSHPIAGSPVPITSELIERLLEKERLFTVYTTKEGAWYAPSAPLHRRECWFLPAENHRHIDAVPSKQVSKIADTLSRVVSVWGEEFPRAHYRIVLHGSMVSGHVGGSWWLQLHEEVPGSDLPPYIEALPERFAQLLHHTVPVAHHHHS